MDSAELLCFLPGFAVKQLFDGLHGRHVVMQNRVNRLGNWHLNAQPRRQTRHFTRGTDAFGNMTEIIKNLRQFLTRGQGQPDLPVSRQVAGTGQNEVAHARGP